MKGVSDTKNLVGVPRWVSWRDKMGKDNDCVFSDIKSQHNLMFLHTGSDMFVWKVANLAVSFSVSVDA